MALALQTRQLGLTLLEILIAVVVLSIALLAVAAGLVGNLTGIREEGRMTVANQVAITVHETLRREIHSKPKAFDKGETDEAFSPVMVSGQAYTGSYTITPVQLDASGTIVAKGKGTPHLFTVSVTVQLPDGKAPIYNTLVSRRPDL